jgi:methionyl-tRNA formyltransferase
MRIVMMGTGTFAEPTFEALLLNFGAEVVGLVTQPERDAGNKRGSTRQTGKGMGNIARSVGLPIATPDSINSAEGLAALRDMRPDLLVVAAYGQILSKDVLTIPTLGCINVHASLLPKYRGAAPVAYAILNGDTQTGVTIIKITPGLDSGDMILQESLDMFPDDSTTTGSLEARLAQLGAKLAVEAVRKYQTGEPMPGVKQDPALVTKAPKIKKEQGLIDWSKSAEEICRHVRAMQPWPTAFTFLHRPGKDPMRVIVILAGEFPVRCTNEFEAGTVFMDPGGHFPKSVFVACGFADNGETRSVVEIEELQPAGKKKMTAEEFLRGYPIVEGMRFGPEHLA